MIRTEYQIKRSMMKIGKRFLLKRKGKIMSRKGTYYEIDKLESKVNRLEIEMKKLKRFILIQKRKKK